MVDPTDPSAPHRGLGPGPEQASFGYRDVPAAEKAGMVRQVFESVAPRYDLMNDLMSCGVHRLWKNALVDVLNPRPGERFLDVAGGTGDVAFRIVRRQGERPDVSVCDINAAMLAVGRDRAVDRGLLKGLSWTTGDAENLPFPDRSFDGYTIAFGLRNVTDVDKALGEAHRVLKPGGRFLLPGVQQGDVGAGGPRLRRLFQPRAAVLRPHRRQGRRVLPLSSREHPPLPAAARTGATHARGRFRQRRLARHDAGRRGLALGLAHLDMFRALRNSWRLLRMALSLARHDALFPLEILGITPALVAWARLFARRRDARRPGERLTAALQEMGPSFIKLGQALSTRADLLSEQVAADLAQLQDHLPAFPGAAARRIIEAELGQPIDALFTSFDDTPVAAASIAQVHFAVTTDGREVAVKVLRPGIELAFERDLDLFYWTAELVERTQPRYRRLKPIDSVRAFADVVRVEMDLRMEAAAARSSARTLPTIPTIARPPSTGIAPPSAC